MDEIRDMHRLEAASSTDLIDSLRQELSQAQAQLHSLTANESTASSALQAVKGEAEKHRLKAKEEEEKCAKAISLLKTVRTKLVKAEKDRDELLGLRDEIARERDEVSKANAEVDRIKAENMRDIQRIRNDAATEVAAVRQRFERELATRNGQFEMELMNVKVRSLLHRKC